MDEKPNRFINNEEKPLDDNGFSSSSNHQNIDNFDDSSNRLQNDQSNQLRPNMPKNINPMMNKKNINDNLNKDKNIKQKARLDKATGGTLGSNESEPLFRKSLFNDELESSDTSNTLNKLRHPIKSLFGKSKISSNSENEFEVSKSASKISKFLRSLLIPFVILGILLVLPVALIVVVVTSAETPSAISLNDFSSKSGDKAIRDYFEYTGIENDMPIVENYYRKVEDVKNIESEIDKNLLIAGMHYGFYRVNGFLDKLEGKSESQKFDYEKLTENIYAFSNQMIYSRVIFDNNIIKRETEEEVEEIITDENGKKKKVKKKIKTYKYECPSSAYTIYTSMKDLCDENAVAKYKNGPNNIDYSTADYCVNYVSDDNISEYKNDPKFNQEMKCVTIQYETNTDSSREKLENFLKYVLIPNEYFEENKHSVDGYSWEKMVSKFTNVVKSDDNYDYNIPAYDVGQKINYYSELNADDKRIVDDSIRMIMDFVEANKQNANLDGKYHIPGAASLPLDFVIREPIEDTINKRITSPFGERTDPITGAKSFHRGVDFSWSTGSDPVYSMLDGVVYSTSAASSDCGIGIIIGHDTDGDGEYNYYTRYCHLSAKFVSKDDIVNNGQQIGIMGSTGRSTGRHLHFEIRTSDFNTRVDPVPYLIDIVKNQSQFTNSPSTITMNEIDELQQKYSNLISGNIKTRKGVALSAKFLIDNVNKLPYYCGGYTSNVIDQNWFSDTTVTDTSCSNYNSNSKYGLDTSGFVSWALTQAGFANRRYTTNELINLGEKIDMFDDRVQLGDLAYKGDKIGIIIELDDTNAIVAYMDTTGLKTSTINRRKAISLFPNVVSMDKFYKKG